MIPSVDPCERARVTAVVSAVRDRWCSEETTTPRAINQGQCFDFADELEGAHPNLFSTLGLGNFMTGGEFSDDRFDLALLDRYWPDFQPPEGFTWSLVRHYLDDGSHGWAYCRQTNLHYDAECVEGVINPFDLPWSKRAFASIRTNIDANRLAA